MKAHRVFPILMVLLLTVACSTPTASPAPAPAPQSSPVASSAPGGSPVAAAAASPTAPKLSGELTLYTAAPPELATALGEAFTKQTGVNVNLFSGDTGGIL